MKWILGTIVLLGMGSLTIGADLPTAKKLSDQEIQKGVSDHLSFDDALRLRPVEAEVKDGVAILTGTVESLYEKDRAVALTETIRGVRAVVDQIVIEQQNRSDDELHSDIVAALQIDPAIDAADISVSAKNGNVTLDGVADSHVVKSLSSQIAKSIRGVKEVTNYLKVKPSESRSDEQIRNEVVRRLKSDVWVTSDLIRVSVNDGLVSLSGVVATVGEKHVAEVDALVTGVKGVDVSNLKVDSDAVHIARRQRKHTAPRYEETLQAVRDALKYDPRIDAADVDVEFEAGFVRLTGSVDTVAAKKAAEQDALRTRHVARVENELVVAANNQAQEKEVAESIRKALQRDIYVADNDIRVAVSDGVAKLSGSTISRSARDRAEEIASKIRGIQSVENAINIEQTVEPPSDLSIKYEVKNRLYWHSSIAEDDIQVTVNDGVVTLTGAIWDSEGYEFATKVANNAGAKRVNNNLTIRTHD